MPSRFVWDCKGSAFFSTSKFFVKIFDFFFNLDEAAQSFQELSKPSFSEGAAKVRLFSLLPNLFHTFLQKNACIPFSKIEL